MSNEYEGKARAQEVSTNDEQKLNPSQGVTEVEVNEIALEENVTIDGKAGDSLKNDVVPPERVNESERRKEENER